MKFSPGELKTIVARGLMAFPVTDFDRQNQFDPRSYAERVAWLSQFKTCGLFAAAGAGEFFSLTPREYSAVLQAAVGAREADIPLFGTSGYGTATAIEFAMETEARGADGLLLLPPYFTEVTAQGLFEHIVAVCRSTRLGVILYNRGNGRIDAPTLARVAKTCPNLIALKDGAGNIEELLRMRSLLGDSLTFINGMPTAEVHAPAYRALGVNAYSSAIFNFAPRTALAYANDLLEGDMQNQAGFIRDFLVPYCEIRARENGYAVSIAKAGVRVIGRSAGAVRPPISDLNADEYQRLAELIGLLKLG